MARQATVGDLVQLRDGSLGELIDFDMERQSFWFERHDEAETHRLVTRRDIADNHSIMIEGSGHGDEPPPAPGMEFCDHDRVLQECRECWQ